MLFNSYIFIFVFLPIVLLGYYAIGQLGRHRIAISWLVGASLFFYGWWNPAYLGLIIFSILVNYAFGIALSGKSTAITKKHLLAAGVTLNLFIIGYFKYANFFIDNLNIVAKTDFNLEAVLLPLAISFFTFQQIAYLVDAYKGKTKEYSFLHYCLFVTFFPQLIAGPIVHHKDMLPQFAKANTYLFQYKNIAVGLTIFIIGLFKKVVIADNFALYATPVFEASAANVMLTFFEAWGGALAYTFQLYFDFSGYSDMAIGLARMFGILLPLNFNSPYKSLNIIDFWRRWHITLSTFLRDYLYIPLGGSRKGKSRRYVNLFATMLIGGLWHGAGWTFIAWGGLHGIYLVINHAWRGFKNLIFKNSTNPTIIGQYASWSITFLAVVVSWVFFRAESFSSATNILAAMLGSNGISLPNGVENLPMHLKGLLEPLGIIYEGMFYNGLVNWRDGIYLILFAFVAILAPNTQQFMINYGPTFADSIKNIEPWRNNKIVWTSSVRNVIAVSIMLFFSLNLLIKQSEFLYFNF